MAVAERRVRFEEHGTNAPKLNDQSLPLDPIRKTPCACHARVTSQVSSVRE